MNEKESVPAVRAAETQKLNCVRAQQNVLEQVKNTASASVLQRQIAYFDHLTQTMPARSLTVAQALEEIQSGRYRQQIEEMQDAAEAAHFARRNRNGSKEKTAEEREYAELKQQLPAVTWSGQFQQRNKSGLVAHSGIICVDIDHAEDLSELRNALQLDPFVLFFFRSPGGYGLKLGVVIDGNHHAASWNALNRYFLASYGVRIDSACRDVTRLCFVAYDPALFLNPDAVPFLHSQDEGKNVQLKSDRGTVQELLSYIPASPAYNDWLRIISAVGSVLPDEEAIELLSAWSPEQKEGEYRHKLNARLKRVQFGTLIYYAKRYGWRPLPGTIVPHSLPQQVKPQQPNVDRMNLIRASEVQPRSIRWLWFGYIPLGHLTLAEGDPGIGKTNVMVSDLPARLSRGDAMPGSSENVLSGNSIILSAEDSPEDTIVPRLLAAGADLTKVHIIQSVTEGGKERLANLSRDVALLREAITKHQARLIVIDPLNAYLGDVDSHKDASIRQVLTPLSQLAQETGAAIVGIRHLTKAAGVALHRGIGSVGYTAAARSVLQFGRDPENYDSPRRIVAVVKSNITQRPPSLAYHLEGVEIQAGQDRISASKVIWEGEVLFTADDLATLPESSEARSLLDDAVLFLKDFVEGKGGSVKATDVFKVGNANGFTNNLLHRAKKKAGVAAQKFGQPGSKEGGWNWCFVPK